MNPKLHWTLFGLILCVGAALRLSGLGDESLWYDESWSWWLANGDLIHKLQVRDAHPPLYYATLTPWIRVSDSEAWMRLLSAIYGILALPLVYRLAQRIGNAGLLAMGLLAVSPYHMIFSQEARSYALLFLEAAIVLNLLLDLRDENRLWKWIALAVAVAAMMYTHYMGAFFLLAAAAMAIVWSRGRKAFAKGALLALAGSIALFLPWIQTAYRHTVLIQKGFWIPFPNAQIVGYSLSQLAVSPVPFGEPRHYAWAAAMWLLALAAPWIARDRKLAVWLLPLLLPIAGEWLVSLSRPLFYTRTFMYVLIPLFVLLAIAIQRLPFLMRPAIAFMAFAAMMPGLIASKANLYKEDWRGCSQLAQRAGPGEAVVIHPWFLQRNVEYYWRTGGTPNSWTTDTSEWTWITDRSKEKTVPALIAERAEREGLTGVWLLRRPYEGTLNQKEPVELDALFPRRFRSVVRNTEIIYWSK